MAKREKVKKFSIESFDNAHYQTTEQYTALVAKLYDIATKEITAIFSKENINTDKPFSFADYPKTLTKIQAIIQQLANNVKVSIENGSKRQWLFANKKNDAFLNTIIESSVLKKVILKKYQDHNLDALKTFQTRKVDGMNLSQRVWKYTKQYKDQIETALDVGLGEGKSAAELSKDVRENLQNPDALFRRVRDKRGQLVLSKKAQAFHPGTGKYRSAHKNAMRLTRSEINMAYREADWKRWQTMDFIIGFEIKRSNREKHCTCKLCDRLQGVYPKTFKFVGWHPQCMCYCIPIFQDNKSFNEQERADLRAALYGLPKIKIPVNQITEYPEEFKKWVNENAEAQKGWNSTPYFIRDNFIDGKLENGLIDPYGFEVNPIKSKIHPDIEIPDAWLVELRKAIREGLEEDKIYKLRTELRERIERRKLQVPYKETYKSKSNAIVETSPFADKKDLDKNTKTAKILADNDISVKIRAHVILQNYKNPEYEINGHLADRKETSSYTSLKKNLEQAKAQGVSSIVYDITNFKDWKSNEITRNLKGKIMNYKGADFLKEIFFVNGNKAISFTKEELLEDYTTVVKKLDRLK